VYCIAEYERLKVKRIAGRIIPAIATTTAAVSGLVSLELVKIAQQRPITAFKNAFINLGISLFAFSEVPTTHTSLTFNVVTWCNSPRR
jgi:ubiquitin-activating enzyme E1-like protein 2